MLARAKPERLAAASLTGNAGCWNRNSVLRRLEQSKRLIATARLGGFLARKQDGWPGWQTIWRGWQRLMWMGEGLATLHHK
jgi:hypothetical protein